MQLPSRYDCGCLFEIFSVGIARMDKHSDPLAELGDSGKVSSSTITAHRLLKQLQLSKHEALLRLVNYKKKLLDPVDNRFILCNRPMQAVFRTDRLSVTEMCRRLDKHFQ